MRSDKTFQERWFPFAECDQSRLEHAARWARTGLVALGLTLGPCAIGNNFEYSSGMRTGMINKFSRKGLLFKTHEGQMALEGITSTGGQVGANVWDFSLDRSQAHGEDRDKLAADLQRYLEEGVKVKVSYVEPLTTWPWRASSRYLVQKVEPVRQ